MRFPKCNRQMEQMATLGAPGGAGYALRRKLPLCYLRRYLRTGIATYAVDGVQYVAVQVGYGGTAMGVGAMPPSSVPIKYENENRIIAFKLGGGAVPTPQAREDQPFPKPPANSASPAQIEHGEIKFVEQCSRCHVLGLSITPDLRKLSPDLQGQVKDIVLKGAAAPLGMESFNDILSEADVEAIQAYVIDQAWQGYNEQEKSKAK